MVETKRFIVNENRKVIDTLDPSREPTGYCDEDDPQDDTHLRETILWGRLRDLLDDVFFDPAPPRPWTDYNGTDYNDHQRRLICARNSMLETLVDVIRATKLNGSEVDASKRVSGTPKQKTRLLHQTSISLFLDDVECLLSDLYGNIDTVAFDDTMSAVRTIVVEFTRYTRRDFFEEHENARDWDNSLEIGIPGGIWNFEKPVLPRIRRVGEYLEAFACGTPRQG